MTRLERAELPLQIELNDGVALSPLKLFDGEAGRSFIITLDRKERGLAEQGSHFYPLLIPHALES